MLSSVSISCTTLSSDVSRFVISDTATETLQFRWVIITPMAQFSLETIITDKLQNTKQCT